MGAALAVAVPLLALAATWAAFPTLPVVVWRKVRRWASARWRRWRGKPGPRVEVVSMTAFGAPVPTMEERVRIAERSLGDLRRGVQRINEDAERGLTVNLQAVPAAVLAILTDALSGIEPPSYWWALPWLVLVTIAFVWTFWAALRDCLSAREVGAT